MPPTRIISFSIYRQRFARSRFSAGQPFRKFAPANFHAPRHAATPDASLFDDSA